MARIPDNELERLKREVPLADLCAKHGIELKPQGKDLIGHCPFHDDRTPSFIVSPAKNLWNCLGACGCGGDNIQFLMKLEKVSFRHAVEILQQEIGVVPEPATIKTRFGTEHPALVEPSRDMADIELMRHVVDYYHRTFLNDSKAMQYLQKRGCFHPEAATRFKLGFANRTLGYRVPTTTAEGKKLKAQLQRLGIMRESGHEHLTGSIVFPIFGRQGQPVQMYGRKITSGLREGTPLHLYLAGEHRGVWNSEALVSQKEWLLCESLIDALSLWCNGFRNVTSSYGVNGFTPDHWALVDEVKPERIVLCYDNDDAGNKAAATLAQQLEARGVKTWRAKLPAGHDINDVVRGSPAPQGALAAVIEASPRIFAVSAPAPGSAEDKHEEPTPSLPEPSLPPEPLIEPDPAPAPSSLAAIAADTEAAKKEEPPPPPPPEKPGIDAPAEQRGEDVEIRQGDRVYRVRGLAKNLSYEVMKVNLRAMAGDRYHIDTLDLYNARHRATFINVAAEETGLKPDIIKKDLGKVLLTLEEMQERQTKKTLEPESKEAAMAEDEREAALELLRDPKLADRILADFDRCGIVGERTNKLVGYIAAASRKLDEPLAVIIQSTSAAGKSSLMDAILAFMPEEERIQYSAMTGQSLFYLGETDIRHKILAIVEEEGAERASYALKLLQSEGELTIASTGKDPNTGRLVTQEYRVEGPVMILLTTTAIDIDEELLNRCIVLTVDESREQTRAIHRLQREAETLDGMLRKLDKAAILKNHRNAQRLLRPLRVINPYASQLTFLDNRTRTRRDHMKYLTLIRTIALLHQYQRPIQTRQHGGKSVQYLEVTREDVALANKLADEVLGRSLDELPPQTRRLLSLADQMTRETCKARSIDRCDCRFSRRDLRDYTGWSYDQVRIHLERLVDLEYVLTHRGGRGQSFVYELIYNGEGKTGGLFMMGLIDAGTLTTTQTLEGEHTRFGGLLEGQLTLNGVGLEGAETAQEPSNHAGCEAAASPEAGKTHTGGASAYAA